MMRRSPARSVERLCDSSLNGQERGGRKVELRCKDDAEWVFRCLTQKGKE